MQLLRLKHWAEVMPTTSIFTWMSGAEGGCLRAAAEPEALDSIQAWLEWNLDDSIGWLLIYTLLTNPPLRY